MAILEKAGLNTTAKAAKTAVMAINLVSISLSVETLVHFGYLILFTKPPPKHLYKKTSKTAKILN